MKKNRAVLWFMMGLGSQLQIIASLSISEAIALIVGPIVLLTNFAQMRRDGVLTYFWIAILVVMGCVIACIANGPLPPFFIIRGLAMTSIMAMAVPFSYWMIKSDPENLKWMFIGGAISSIVCIFVFQKSVEVAINARGLEGAAAVEGIMSGPLFWIQRLGSFLSVPALGWYMKIPLLYSIGAPLFMAFFSICTSTSGRSAALGFIGAAALCIIGGKKRSTIMKINRRFGFYVIVAVVSVFLANAGYRIVATSGLMGEKSLKKYEEQTKQGSGILNLLLSGRAESFAGLFACFDKPIVGWGPWAMDKDGYWLDFINKYGDPDDYKVYYESELRHGSGMIPCHSHIVEFWLWYGIFGLILWLYVLYVFMRFMKQDCAAVPQWFFWLACSIPGTVWHIFFSPLGSRTGIQFFVVACLMARAVRKGTFKLPASMEQEIWEAEQKR